MQQHTHAGVLLDYDQHKKRHQELLFSFETAIQKWIDDIVNDDLVAMPIVELFVWFGKKIKQEKEDFGVKTIDELDEKKQRELHVLHSQVDELVADWVKHQEVIKSVSLSRTSANSILDWAKEQAEYPTDVLHDRITEDPDEASSKEEAIIKK